MTAVPLAEVWRGDMLESVHLGHAVVVDGTGQIVHAWGDPGAVIYPRSSVKMIQALPLVESGAADAFGLSSRHLALACASHIGSKVHTDLVESWLSGIGLAEPDLRCGAQMPEDSAVRHAMIRNGEQGCQIHNVCSGKHCGFLTLGKHLGAGPEYVELDHPVQLAFREAFEALTGQTAAHVGVDGCAAPTLSTPLEGLARAMAFYANAARDGSARGHAAQRFVAAMMAHPELVAGEGRPCTEFMRAVPGLAAVKFGAEAVYIGILPEQGFGIALKVIDGGLRGAEAAIAAILVRLGLLDPAHPAAQTFMTPVLRNRRGDQVGFMRPAAELLA